MRGTKAKAIRRACYGELAQRDARYARTSAGVIIREPLRRQYQAAKALCRRMGRAWRSARLFAPLTAAQP